MFSARAILSRLRQQWFIVGVVAAILLAKQAPWVGAKDGPLRPRTTVQLLVGAIFLSIGLTLKTQTLRESVFEWRIHVLVQGFSLMAAPVAVMLACNAFERVVDMVTEIDGPNHKELLSMLEGVKVLACMPPSVSSAVILIRAVGGNVAAGILNSTLGSLLGVVVTPLMLLEVTGASASVPTGQMLARIGSQIVLPIAVGQAARAFGLVSDATLDRLAVSKMSSAILIIIIYTVFCQTFSDELPIRGGFLLLLVVLLALAMAGFMAAVWLLAATVFPSLSRKDIISVVFLASHKSLTLGMPLLKILFESHQEVSVAVISIPLLIYHPLQILVGSCLVTTFREYIENDKTTTTTGGKGKIKVDDEQTVTDVEGVGDPKHSL